jgi:thiamine-monophosphate kinase
VTGPLGGSILGKHLDFTPRVREALLLHEYADLHAMIDLSDGLAADVGHLCDESGVGAVLRAESIPLTPEAHRMKDGNSPLEHGLGDGEDFELVFAVTPEDARKLLGEQPVPGITFFHIGEVVSEGLWLEEGGQRRPLARKGYVHTLES